MIRRVGRIAALHNLAQRIQYPTLAIPSSRSMYSHMSVTFLGTSSGGGPTLYRNCSSLVADVLGDGSLWMACLSSVCYGCSLLRQYCQVDCAEGTFRQFLFHPYSDNKPRASRVTKIFITHMHGTRNFYSITLAISYIQLKRITSWVSYPC
jgi:hypothetical protein